MSTSLRLTTMAPVGADNSAAVAAAAADVPPPIRIQVRLEAVEGQPIEEFLLEDWPQTTYEALSRKVLSMSIPPHPHENNHQPSQPQPIINLDEYNVTLKYRPVKAPDPNWWVSIRDTGKLHQAILDALESGLLCLEANVSRKLIAAASAPLTAAHHALPADCPTTNDTDNNAVAVAKKSAIAVSAKPPSKKKKSSGSDGDAGGGDDKPPKKKKKPTTVKHSVSLGSNGVSVAGKDKRSVEQKILGALAELKVLRIEAPPRVQVALFSGYLNVKSAGFAKAMCNVKTKGYIEYPNKSTIRLTDAGSAVSPPVVDPPRNNADVHARIKKLLKPIGAKMFDVLADGKAHDRGDVALAMGYTNEKSSGFAKALSTMSSLGILGYPKDPDGSKTKMVQLTDIAFPYGRTASSLMPTNTNGGLDFPSPCWSL